MSRIHRMYLRLTALLCVSISVLAPRAMWAQEVAPSRATEAAADSVPKPEVAPTISNMPAIRRRLEAAATTLVNTDESLIGTERSVRVRVIVGVDGAIESLFIEQSSANAAVDAAALRIVRTARFTAGRTAGVAVRSAVVLPLRFVFPDQ